MVGELSDDEQLVRDWLKARGYPNPQYEASIVTDGRKPDFLAVADDDGVGPAELWAEVKSLRPEQTAISIGKAWEVLKRLGMPDGLHGHAMLHVSELTREQSIRALVKLFF